MFLLLVLGVSVVHAVNNRQWSRTCTYQRPAVHGTDTFTFLFKPDFKMISLEIVSADKSFQLISRKEFDNENEYLPSCESVESAVMNDDRSSATATPWRYWNRATALSQLAGVVKPAQHYCPLKFPFTLEQSAKRLKIDCLYRGIGDAILLYLSQETSAECAAAVDTALVDSLCRSVADWTKKFVASAVEEETETRRRNRQIGTRITMPQSAPQPDVVNQLIMQRREFFEPPPEMDYWDVSDDEVSDIE